MQAPPEPMQLPLEECMQTTSQNRAVVSTLLWPVRPVHHTDQTGGQDRPHLGTHTSQTSGWHRLGWLPCGNCTSSTIARNHLWNF
jgi:hypothetical protein